MIREIASIQYHKVRLCIPANIHFAAICLSFWIQAAKSYIHRFNTVMLSDFVNFLCQTTLFIKLSRSLACILETGKCNNVHSFVQCRTIIIRPWISSTNTEVYVTFGKWNSIMNLRMLHVWMHVDGEFILIGSLLTWSYCVHRCSTSQVSKFISLKKAEDNRTIINIWIANKLFIYIFVPVGKMENHSNMFVNQTN